MRRRVMRWGALALHPPGTGLVVGVVSWWLLVAGAVVVSLPESVASSSPTPSTVAPGMRARIHQPGIPHWPIPAERHAFDAFQRGMRESDEAAIEAAFEASEWLAMDHGLAVWVVAVDGEAVQIELLEGPYRGRRGWLKPRNLVTGD